jgi:hypothetical protein
MNRGADVSRESAEDALRQKHWETGFDYWVAANEAGDPALEWLGVMEQAALPHAIAGDLVAQQVLGSIGILQYTSGPASAIDPLRRGLQWIVSALRQELSPVGLQMLVVWYGTLRHNGVRDADIDSYLSQPEPRAVWQELMGTDSFPW